MELKVKEIAIKFKLRWIPIFMGRGLERFYSDQEEHFKFIWRVVLERKDEENCEIFLQCYNNVKGQKFSVDTNFEIRLGEHNHDVCYEWHHVFANESVRNNYGGHCGGNFNWDILENKFVKNLHLAVNVRIQINKTVVFGRKKLTDFSMLQSQSDLLLTVQDQKFYVVKEYLTSQCSYFKSLLSETYQEGKHQQITLQQIDPFDLQNFLEVLYGDLAIDANSLEGILFMADMYDAPDVKELCKQYLLKKLPRCELTKSDIIKKYSLNVPVYDQIPILPR